MEIASFVMGVIGLVGSIWAWVKADDAQSAVLKAQAASDSVEDAQRIAKLSDALRKSHAACNRVVSKEIQRRGLYPQSVPPIKPLQDAIAALAMDRPLSVDIEFDKSLVSARAQLDECLKSVMNPTVGIHKTPWQDASQILSDTVGDLERWLRTHRNKISKPKA